MLLFNRELVLCCYIPIISKCVCRVLIIINYYYLRTLLPGGWSVNKHKKSAAITCNYTRTNHFKNSQKIQWRCAGQRNVPPQTHMDCDCWRCQSILSMLCVAKQFIV